MTKKQMIINSGRTYLFLTKCLARDKDLYKARICLSQAKKLLSMLKHDATETITVQVGM